MALEPWALAVALAANVAVGAGLVVAVYTLMERRILYGALAGLVLGGLIVYAEATVGADLFDLTFEEKRLLTMVAGVGAGVGIVGTLSAVKPELE